MKTCHHRQSKPPNHLSLQDRTHEDAKGGKPLNPEIEQYLRECLHYNDTMITILKLVDKKLEEMDREPA